MSKKKNNILINNVVPLNNGDVALFLSVYLLLIKKGYEVKIATYYYKQAKKLYPDLPFVKELGDYQIFVKLPFLKPFLLPILFLLSKPFREANIIIGAPGGYINSNYKIKNSLSIFKIAKYFKKKTFIYAQSVGPLNKKDELFFKKLISKSIDFIYVRDLYSFNILNKLNIPKIKYKLTYDAAFLLENNSINKNKTNTVAFSVRTWKYDDRNILNYQIMISKLVQLTIDKGYKVDFLSTCQGIENYKNDADIAQEIYNRLSSNYKKNVTVIKNYYSFNEFYDKLNNYDFVVGTRLHMCITALTKLIPAFNISYEIKGLECFNYLGLSDYSIDYNESLENAITIFNNFINQQNKIKTIINRVIPEIHKNTVVDFNYFITNILSQN